MAVWDKTIPWGFMLLLAGAAGQSVNYPDDVCAVSGSTVTLPCTFTPVQSVIQDGGEVQIEIKRVVWCRDHEICQGSTTSVYDSDSKNSLRYRYLGDMKGNCTLQITDIQKSDEGILRFRMEGDNDKGDFTGPSGVNVTVFGGFQMKIRSSGGDRQMRRGEAVTLRCVTPCPIQLEFTWFRDGHALSDSGPALQLGPLTTEDSGNYHCGVKAIIDAISEPYSLRVKAEETEDGKDADEEGTVGSLLAVRLVLFALHTLLIVALASIVIRRTCLRGSSRALKDVTVQPPAFVEEL